MKVEWTNRDNLSIETTSQNSKAILVLDKMPNSCEECIVRCDGYSAKEYAQRTIVKPTWCPLKFLPPKLDENDWHRMFSGLFSERAAKGYGWNAYHDAITGETE